MATVQEIITLFFDPTRKRFPVPAPFDVEQLTRDITQALSPFSAYQLDQAALYLRDNRTQKTFPTVADCRHTCERFLERRPDSVTTYEPEFVTVARDDLSRREAAALCRCPLGETADKEGWLVALVDFCRQHKRLPQGREIDRCIALARRSENALYDCRSSKLYPSLVRMRIQMLNKATFDVFAYWPDERRTVPDTRDSRQMPAEVIAAAKANLESLREQPLVVGEPLRKYIDEKMVPPEA